MLRALATVLVLASLATPAFAQDRTPAARQALVDLANVLGESHALLRACKGRDSFHWYSKMEQMLRVEAADQTLKVRLIESFNTGYTAGMARYPSCSNASRAQAAQLATRGRILAGPLAQP